VNEIKKFLITYGDGQNIGVKTIFAYSREDARKQAFLEYPDHDISVNEIVEQEPVV